MLEIEKKKEKYTSLSGHIPKEIHCNLFGYSNEKHRATFLNRRVFHVFKADHFLEVSSDICVMIISNMFPVKDQLLLGMCTQFTKKFYWLRKVHLIIGNGTLCITKISYLKRNGFQIRVFLIHSLQYTGY